MDNAAAGRRGFSMGFRALLDKGESKVARTISVMISGAQLFIPAMVARTPM